MTDKPETEKEEKCKRHGGTGDGKTCAAPDWEGKCELCEETPTVCCTGLCGPCTFGEADTAGGNW